MSERKKTVGGGGGAGGKEMKLTKKTKAVKEKDRSTLTCLDSIMRCRNCFELIYSGKWRGVIRKEVFFSWQRTKNNSIQNCLFCVHERNSFIMILLLLLFTKFELNLQKINYSEAFIWNRARYIVTSLGDFWKFLAIKFLAKEAQIIGNFLDYFEKLHSYSKTALATFWATFEKMGYSLLQNLVTLVRHSWIFCFKINEIG